jgi:riboflavin synthase
LLGVEDHGESWTFRIEYPKEIARYLVFKGSVAVEGISLTIAGLTDDYFEIAIIPKTWEVTNLRHLKPGDDVNIEVDVHRPARQVRGEDKYWLSGISRAQGRITGVWIS